MILVVLLIFGAGILFLLDGRLLWYAAIYLGINWAYTLRLKQIPLIDFVVVAIGFVLRLFIGVI